MREYTEEDISSIVYFHEEKNDITRYSSWEGIKESVFRDYPELEKAMKDIRVATRMINIVVSSLEE